MEKAENQNKKPDNRKRLLTLTVLLIAAVLPGILFFLCYRTVLTCGLLGSVREPINAFCFQQCRVIRNAFPIILLLMGIATGIAFSYGIKHPSEEKKTNARIVGTILLVGLLIGIVAYVIVPYLFGKNQLL